MPGPPIAPHRVNAHTLGPSARQFVIQTPESGRVAYVFEGRPARYFDLSPILGNRRLGVLSMPDADAFLNIQDNGIVALGHCHRDGPLAFLMGERYGLLVNRYGVAQQCQDPLGAMLETRLPCIIQRDPMAVLLRFVINPYNRERFSNRLLEIVKDTATLHTLELAWDPASGKLQKSRIMQVKKETQEVLYAASLDEFPLMWPDEITAIADGSAEEHQPPPGDGEAMTDVDSPRRKTEDHLARPLDATPSTIHLPIPEMLEAIQNQDDELAQWTMILENLKLESTDRTYHLLARFGKLISEQTAHWRDKTIARFFRSQRGPAFLSLLTHYSAGKILSLLEDRPDRDIILDWLRERETERLLRLDASEMPATREEARAILSVDEQTEPETIRRAWRCHLSWLSADPDRHVERAIHKRKDAIAQLLHEARDLLLG